MTTLNPQIAPRLPVKVFYPDTSATAPNNGYYEIISSGTSITYSTQFGYFLDNNSVQYLIPLVKPYTSGTLTTISGPDMQIQVTNPYTGSTLWYGLTNIVTSDSHRCWVCLWPGQSSAWSGVASQTVSGTNTSQASVAWSSTSTLQYTLCKNLTVSSGLPTYAFLQLIFPAV